MSSIFGFLLILSLLFSIQNFDDVVGSSYGQPVLQILLDIFGEDGAIILFTLICLCVWHCGLFSITSNSRMMVRPPSSISAGEAMANRALCSSALPATAACRISSTTSTPSCTRPCAQSGLL